MELSLQNKTFLAHLHKLDVDLSQFTDKSFDGLFDNVPESLNYFFNWFLENITPDNVLTKLEEAEYFELEKNNWLPNSEETDYILSGFKPTFEELQNLDVGYINNFLSDELKDLKINHKELSEIYENVVESHNIIKKKQNEAKEKINLFKKQFNTFHENCQKTNLQLLKKVDDVKMILLSKPNLSLDTENIKTILKDEQTYFQKFNTCSLFSCEAFSLNGVQSLPKLEENLINAELVLLLSRGVLQSKQVKMEILTEFLKNMADNKNIENSNSSELLALDIGEINEISVRKKEIKMLENELYKQIKMSSNFEIQTVKDNYLLDKAGLYNSIIDVLQSCRNHVRSNCQMNSWLLHILLESVESLKKIKTQRKNCLSKLNLYGSNFHNNFKRFQLRTQKFKQVTTRSAEQHPLQLTLMSALKQREEGVELETKPRNIIKLINHACYESNFESHKLKVETQLQIKSLLSKVLCGPTSQVLHVPVELLVRTQQCEKSDQELSHEIKRYLNKFLETKESVMKSDRKNLLLWCDFLLNPKTLEALVPGKLNCS